MKQKKSMLTSMVQNSNKSLKRFIDKLTPWYVWENRKAKYLKQRFQEDYLSKVNTDLSHFLMEIDTHISNPSENPSLKYTFKYLRCSYVYSPWLEFKYDVIERHIERHEYRFSRERKKQVIWDIERHIERHEYRFSRERKKQVIWDNEDEDYWNFLMNQLIKYTNINYKLSNLLQLFILDEYGQLYSASKYYNVFLDFGFSEDNKYYITFRNDYNNFLSDIILAPFNTGKNINQMAFETCQIILDLDNMDIIEYSKKLNQVRNLLRLYKDKIQF